MRARQPRPAQLPALGNLPLGPLMASHRQACSSHLPSIQRQTPLSTATVTRGAEHAMMSPPPLPPLQSQKVRRAARACAMKMTETAS